MTNNSVWPKEIHRVLKEARVSQATHVPDAGHAQSIELPLPITHARHDARRMGEVQSPRV